MTSVCVTFGSQYVSKQLILSNPVILREEKSGPKEVHGETWKKSMSQLCLALPLAVPGRLMRLLCHATNSHALYASLTYIMVLRHNCYNSRQSLMFLEIF